jgi:hypothetical protein
MAPIKLEDNIREKLEEREIQPSDGAWKKLNVQLAGSNKGKNNKTIWYAIAASVVGVLLLASVFMNKFTESSVQPIDIVDAQSSEKEINRQNDLFLPEIINSEEVVQGIGSDESPKMNQKAETENTINRSTHQKSDAPILATNSKIVSETIAKVNPDSDKKVDYRIQEDNIKISEELLIDNRVDEVIAEVELLQNGNNVITNTDIDALLANAKHQIEKRRVPSTKKVDPAELLGDVEWDLDRSFRDKVYDALNDGYDIIRTAVVERNN